MLTSSYPIKGSNLGPFVENIVNGLINNGVEVGVMIFSTTTEYKEYEKNGAKIYEYPYTLLFPPILHKNMGLIPSVKSSFLAKFELIGYFLGTRKYLKKIAKDYDVIHAHWLLPSGFIACSTKNKIKKPIITTAWGAEFHLPNNFIVKKALNYVNKNSDSIVAVSRYMKKKAEDYLLDTDDIKVIPNCVDTKQFSAKRTKSDKIIIATIRRLVPEKRIQDLIKAVAKLPDELKEKITLWIIGDGPEKAKLEVLTKEMRINNITKFWGMVEHDKIPSLLNRIDIYVNPSIQEGMATANLEAMTAGCCVIATNGVGNDEMIEHRKTGLLYNSKNIEELSAYLKTVITDKRLRQMLANKGRKRIINTFSNSKIADRYLKIYLKLIGKNKVVK